MIFGFIVYRTKRKEGEMRGAKPITIVSTGRTGTEFFSKLFADVYSGQVDAYHERGASRPIQILTNMYFGHFLPLSMLRLGWTVFKGWEVPSCKKEFHIDSNCFLYGLVTLAPDLYSGLKVIHIVRDPREYVTSHLNYALQKRTSFVANYLVPFWQPNPFLVGEIPWRRLINLSRFERYSWIWDFKNRVMESIETSSVPYLRLRFEDIFRSGDPVPTFQSMVNFIGLPLRVDALGRFRQPENRSAVIDFPAWREWSPMQCRLLNDLCGSHMRRYGYGYEPEWLKKLKED